jgi:hypothetical protein
MDQQKINILNKIAEDFGNIARKVNESSQKRKSHADNTLNNIKKCIELSEGLTKDITSVAKLDNDLRDQNNIVLNTCKIINNNIKKQNELLTELKEKNAIDNSLEEAFKSKINYLSETTAEAIKYVVDIIEKNNELILMDDILLMRKRLQLEALEQLQKDTEISANDAQKAIEGSQANLERGLEMVERYKSVQQLVEQNKKADLEQLMKDANKGWNIAVNVNESSKNQFEFAEKVNQFTAQLHADSSTIKDTVNFKHDFFESNIQTITVLTVILSLKLKKYLDIEDLLKSIEKKDSYREQLISLKSHIKIACKDIKKLSVMNYDMADSTLLNNEVETNTVELTTQEIELYDNIKDEVTNMTDATKYPVEGSGENITNGKLLENHLKEIIDQL